MQSRAGVCAFLLAQVFMTVSLTHAELTVSAGSKQTRLHTCVHVKSTTNTCSSQIRFVCTDRLVTSAKIKHKSVPLGWLQVTQMLKKKKKAAGWTLMTHCNQCGRYRKQTQAHCVCFCARTPYILLACVPYDGLSDRAVNHKWLLCQTQSSICSVCSCHWLCVVGQKMMSLLFYFCWLASLLSS